MTLQRLNRNLTRLKTNRKPLGFLKPVPDPMLGMTPAETNEASINNEVKAVKTAIGERLKIDAARKKLATAADDYFVVAFESGTQATAFLRALNYPDLTAAFIDGTILADHLKIELPKAEKIRPLKTTHDRSLTALVQPAWRK